MLDLHDRGNPFSRFFFRTKVVKVSRVHKKVVSQYILHCHYLIIFQTNLLNSLKKQKPSLTQSELDTFQQFADSVLEDR